MGELAEVTIVVYRWPDGKEFHRVYDTTDLEHVAFRIRETRKEKPGIATLAIVTGVRCKLKEELRETVVRSER